VFDTTDNFRLHSNWEFEDMAVESGPGADDDPNSKQKQPADNVGPELESEKPARKVAKTILEGALPHISNEMEGKKVAKTMLEVPRPATDNVEPSAVVSVNPELPDSPESITSVAKTNLEIPRPDLSQLETTSVAEQGLFEPPKRKIPKTMIDVSRPELSGSEFGSPLSGPELSDSESAQSPANVESPAPGRTVPKTMLEVSRPDRSSVDSNSVSTEVEPIIAPAAPPRKAARTMLELSLPAESATAKQVRKISKTMLDADSLDAIGMAKALNLPLKIAKSLSQPIIRRAAAVSNLSDVDKTVKTEDYSGLDRTVKTQDSSELDRTVQTQDSSGLIRTVRTQGSFELDSTNLDRTVKAEDYSEIDRTVKTDIEPYRSERFVARTMLDHTVLSEALVRSAEKDKVRAGELAKERAKEPVKEFHQVDSKKMATPCAWTWSESGGKDRVRSCSKCQTQVYDFTGMERPEAEALIFKQESRKKASLYKRADGKFMTKDCPVQVQRKRNLFLLCFFGVVIMISAIASMVLMPPQPKPPAPTAAKKSNSVDAEKHGTSKAPTKGADGAIHFEAGQTVKPFSSAVDSVLPVVNGKSGTTATTTTTTTNTSSEDEKYWDSPAK
jgi:hypothetical protein